MSSFPINPDDPVIAILNVGVNPKFSPLFVTFFYMESLAYQSRKLFCLEVKIITVVLT